jgi:type IV secretory pathway VirB10-like protein
MTMNDLTAPLGQDPRRHRRAIEVSAAQIIAVALGLFFGAFVLWAVTAEDRSGGEPIAVAPADLHIAKKAPEVIAVPQAAAPAESTQPATTAALPPTAPANSQAA